MNFKKEIFNVIAILVIFDISYVLRATWNMNFFGFTSVFVQISGSILLSIIFDFLPLSLVMLFHYRNFKQESIDNQDEQLLNVCRDSNDIVTEESFAHSSNTHVVLLKDPTAS